MCFDSLFLIFCSLVFSTYIFSSYPGVGCNRFRPKVAGVFEILPKYCTCTSALVPEKEIFAG